jgi:hypothetical protein
MIYIQNLAAGFLKVGQSVMIMLYKVKITSSNLSFLLYEYIKNNNNKNK